MRIIALLFIVFILASLASALYYLIKDKGQSDRTVKMLPYVLFFRSPCSSCSWVDITSGLSRQTDCADSSCRNKKPRIARLYY